MEGNGGVGVVVQSVGSPGREALGISGMGEEVLEVEVEGQVVSAGVVSERETGKCWVVVVLLRWAR